MEKIRDRQPERTTLELDTKGEDLQGRCCLTCACSFLIKKPAVQPIEMSPKEFDAMREMRVCRLNPPVMVPTPQGPRPFQQPVLDQNVCWQYRQPGALPGERLPIESLNEAKEFVRAFLR